MYGRVGKGGRERGREGGREGWKEREIEGGGGGEERERESECVYIVHVHVYTHVHVQCMFTCGTYNVPSSSPSPSLPATYWASSVSRGILASSSSFLASSLSSLI